MQRRLVRRAAMCLKPAMRDLSWAHIRNAVDVASEGHIGACATLPDGLVLRVDYERLHIAVAEWQPPRPDWPRVLGHVDLPIGEPITLPSCSWRVTARVIVRSDLRQDWQSNPDRFCLYLDADRVPAPLHLRPRRPGDWLVPLGLDHRQTVKKLMINIRLPRAERAETPLLLSGDDILWVTGWRVDGRYAIADTTSRILIVRFEPEE